MMRNVVLAALFCAAALAAACAKQGASNIEGRVAVIGIDGADWDLVARWADEGKLPTFDRLRREGSFGVLRSFEPMLSPVLWATVATGAPPEEHGIADFWFDATRFSKSSDRKVKAVWNRVSDAGGTAGVVGWLTTHPAEKIRGYVVSDRTSVLSFMRESPVVADPAGKTHPPALFARLAPHIVRPETVTAEDLRAVFGVERGPDDSTTGHLRGVAAQTKTYEAIALDMLRREKVDLFMLYFQGVDTVSHAFIKYVPPRMPDVSEDDAVLHGGVVEAFYRHQDAVLGRILAALPPETTAFVVSDHGFRHGYDRLSVPSGIEGGYAPAWHREEGILFIHGPGVRPGFRVEPASLYDVAPTVLWRLGLPNEGNLKGRVWIEAFADENSDELALREQLESLGYIGAGGKRPAPQVNIAVSHLARGEIEKAEAIYREILASNPRDAAANRGMGECAMARRDHESAMRFFRAALDVNPKDVAALLGWVNAAMDLRRFEEVRPVLRNAVADHPYNPDVLIALAKTEAALGNADEARLLTRKALMLNPQHAGAKALDTSP